MTGQTVRAWFVMLGILLTAGCGSADADLTGSELAVEVGCPACHDEVDSELAPTLEGLWGSDVLLEDGRTVVADEAYVRTSIINPQDDVVAGYEGRMPAFALTDSEVEQLVDYVRGLG